MTSCPLHISWRQTKWSLIYPGGQRNASVHNSDLWMALLALGFGNHSQTVWTFAHRQQQGDVHQRHISILKKIYIGTYKENLYIICFNIFFYKVIRCLHFFSGFMAVFVILLLFLIILNGFWWAMPHQSFPILNFLVQALKITYHWYNGATYWPDVST